MLRIIKNKSFDKFYKILQIHFKIHEYNKDPYEAKYEFLIDKHEQIGVKHFEDLKNFVEYANNCAIHEKSRKY